MNNITEASDLACTEGLNCTHGDSIESVIPSEHQLATDIFYGILLGIFTLLGIGLNCFLVGLIIVRQNLQSICNKYILFRAIPDIIFQIPNFVIIASFRNDEFVYGYSVCILYSVVTQVACLLSSATFVSIALDYYVGSRPERYHRHYRENLRFNAFGVLGFGAMMVAIGLGFYKHYVLLDDNGIVKRYCFPGPFFFSWYSLPLGIVCWFLTAIVPVVLVWIFIGLAHSKRASSGGETSREREPPPEYRPPNFTKKYMITLAVIFTVLQVGFWSSLTFVFIPFVFQILRVFFDINVFLNGLIAFIYCKNINVEVVKILPKFCKKEGESFEEVPVNEVNQE